MDPIRVTGEQDVFLCRLCLSRLTVSGPSTRSLMVFLSVVLQCSAANRTRPNKDDTYWKEINAAMALTNLAQGKDSAQGTASCIIQKSSHIAEVKTVRVPLGPVLPF